MTSYNNDQPIASECEDKLNRQHFAKEIASLLVLEADAPCLTVSLEGKWGQGKTSILNMVQEVFSQMDFPPVLVQYNAWANGQSESLLQDFLIQFTSQLGLADHAEEGKRVAEELLSYSKLFSVAKLVPGVEPWGSLVENVFKGVGDATQSLSDLKELDIAGKKARVEESLRKIDRPIVVIIDDIDRLTPKECFQVLRLVKAVADFPRTAFILAFEPNYLESVLASNNIDNANEYIDKIVQLRIPLPTITSKDLDALVDRHFDMMGDNFSLAHYQDEQNRLAYIYQRYLRYIITSPRDVKRVFNHFKFVYNLVQNQVCVTDLFVLSVVATKAHKIYSHIKSNPALYAGKRNSGYFDYGSLDKEKAADLCKQQRLSIYNALLINENNVYEDLLKEIFPSLDSKSYQTYEVYDADASGRVDHISRLSTALHISTPRGSVSDQDVATFIESSGQRIDILESAISNGAIKRFLELFEMFLDRRKFNDDELLLLIRVIVDTLLSEDLLDGFGILHSGLFAESNLYGNICRLLNRTLRESENREAFVCSVMQECVLLPFVASSIVLLKAQYNERNYEPPWLDEETINKMIKEYIPKARAVLLDDVFQSKALEYQVIKPLWRYDEDAALSIIKEIGQDNVFRVGWFLLGQIGSDSVKGHYLSVNLDKACSVLNLDRLKKESQTVKESELSREDIVIARSIVDGKAHYLADGEVVID
ncbi:P-loop NTPase fold protein [Vibrio sp. 10N.222.54.A1]|uniref:KAP NTPase domain-containing protein n=2 Tax=Vibrio TaxID=662 RepID=A0A7Z1MJJ4_9VIBR|nr:MULTISPECIES: P-loop NTPase fold protein [Vibrio]MCW8345474.1 KAP family NTPase [Vibrio qingdaonensis]PMK83823.1 hypothetical protein BCT92_10575 [Vibrio sp. 10N.261.52.E5]PMP25071.1 hypothetical protein BCS91_12470 [Vibrio cyclitrophicus]PMP29978.1 hypothetical protein BCS90_00805 [Vibrio cyclitrophicus]TKF83791.1 hypothetical protein FCV65_09195 [Vibrio sp. F13]